MDHDDQAAADHDDDHEDGHGHDAAPDPGRWVLGPLVVGLVLGVIVLLALGVDSSVARL